MLVEVDEEVEDEEGGNGAGESVVRGARVVELGVLELELTFEFPLELELPSLELPSELLMTLELPTWALIMELSPSLELLITLELPT